MDEVDVIYIVVVCVVIVVVGILSGEVVVW